VEESVLLAWFGKYTGMMVTGFLTLIIVLFVIDMLLASYCVLRSLLQM
jgi:hypothetical protein